MTPERFSDVWNAAQAVAAVQVALGANSPFLFGRELWRESRPPLFQQATDTRPPELQNQGCVPGPGSGSGGRVRRTSSSRRTCATSPAPAHLRRGGAAAGPRRGRGAPAPGTRAAQRHGLPLEPAGVRAVGRRSPPPGGEPGAARRTDRRGCDRQRRALLRARAGPGRGVPPGVDEDAVRRGGRELRHRLPPGHRRRAALAPARPHRRADPGAGDQARTGRTAAAGGRRARRVEHRSRRPRPLPRHHRGALQAADQRGVLAGGHLSPGA